MRLGLANLPLILALDLFPGKAFFLLALIKVLGQGLITGTLFSSVLLFSLAGTFSSALLMYLLRRCSGRGRIGLTGISVIGAMGSNGSQLILAGFFIFRGGIKFLIPPFLGAGLLTGFILGLLSEFFTSRSVWYGLALGAKTGFPGPLPPALAAGGAGEAPVLKTKPLRKNASPGEAGKKREPLGRPAGGEPADHNIHPRFSRTKTWETLFLSRDLCITGLIMTAAFLLNASTAFRVVQFFLFWFLAWLSGKKNNPLFTLAVIGGILLFNLVPPYGKVLAEFGPFPITQGSLLAGLRKAVTLEGLFMLSRTVIRGDLRFPGVLGSLLGESLRLFSRISERKREIHRKNWIEEIDRLLLDLSIPGETRKEEPEAGFPPGEVRGNAPGTGGEAPGASGTDPADRPRPGRFLRGRLILAAAGLLTAGLSVLPGLISPP
jgi:heptaprenyl diphosphate synthase